MEVDLGEKPWPSLLNRAAKKCAGVIGDSYGDGGNWDGGYFGGGGGTAVVLMSANFQKTCLCVIKI